MVFRRTVSVLCTVTRNYEGLFGNNAKEIARKSIIELASLCRKDNWGKECDEMNIKCLKVLGDMKLSEVTDLSEISEIAHAVATVRPKVKLPQIRIITEQIINESLAITYGGSHKGLTAAHASRLLVAAATIKVTNANLVRGIASYTKYNTPKEELAVTVWAGAVLQASPPRSVLVEAVEYHKGLLVKNNNVDIRIQRAFLWGVYSSLPLSFFRGNVDLRDEKLKKSLCLLASELVNKTLGGGIGISDMITTACTCGSLGVKPELISKLCDVIYSQPNSAFNPEQCIALLATSTINEIHIPKKLLIQSVRHIVNYTTVEQNYLNLLTNLWQYALKIFSKPVLTDMTIFLYRDALASILTKSAKDFKAAIDGDQYFLIVKAAIDGEFLGPLQQKLIDHMASIDVPGFRKHSEGKWAPRLLAIFRKRVEQKLCSNIEKKMVRYIMHRAFDANNTFPEMRTSILVNILRICVLLASRGEATEGNLSICEKVLFSLYVKGKTAGKDMLITHKDFISPIHIKDVIDSVKLIQMEDMPTIVPHFISLTKTTLGPETVASAIELGMEYPEIFDASLKLLSQGQIVASLSPSSALSIIESLSKLKPEVGTPYRQLINSLTQLVEDSPAKGDTYTESHTDDRDIALFKTMISTRSVSKKSSKYSQLLIQLRNSNVRKEDIYRKAVSFLITEKPDICSSMTDIERMLTVHSLSRAIPRDSPVFIMSLLRAIDVHEVVDELGRSEAMVGKLFMFIDGVSRLSHFRKSIPFLDTVAGLRRIFTAVAEHSECGILALTTLAHISYSFSLPCQTVFDKLHLEWDINILKTSVASKLINAVSMLKVSNDNLYENILRHVVDTTEPATMTVVLSAFRRSGKKPPIPFIDRAVDLVMRLPAERTGSSVVELMLTFAVSHYKDPARCAQIHSRFVSDTFSSFKNTELLTLLRSYTLGETIVSKGVIAKMRTMVAANVKKEAKQQAPQKQELRIIAGRVVEEK